jgi:anti-anti-sigma factor
MGFEINERRAGSVLILELDGRLTMGEGSEALDQRVQELIAGAAGALLVDCRKVSTIDSRGIKSLVQAYVSFKNRGGALKLLRPSPRVREVLGWTHLDTVIESFEDEAAALKSF